MFSGTWNVSADIIIKDASFEVFTDFLAYFYKSRLTFTMANIATILHLSHKYNVENLCKRCVKYLMDHIDGDNAIVCLGLVKHYQLQLSANKWTILGRAVKQAPFTSNDYLDCDMAALQAVQEMLRTSPNPICEEIIFDTAIRWAKHKCTENELDATIPNNLRDELGKCFALEHFKRMTRGGFAKRYISWKEMFTREEAEEIFLHLCDKQSSGGEQ